MVNGAWTTSFYGYDGGGSVRQLTDSAGEVTDKYEYDAFGNSFTNRDHAQQLFVSRRTV